MEILFLSSEVRPFAKTGGLADVAGSLPLAVKSHGVDIRIFMPKYPRFLESLSIDLKNLGEISFSLGKRKISGGLDETSLDGVPLYMLDIPSLYDRENIYGTSLGDYSDNAFRFAVFARAALEISKIVDFHPSIYHLNDWQTALLPYFLKSSKIEAKTVLTIHNLAYQGSFEKGVLEEIGLPEDEIFIKGGKINFLKVGILEADVITTVSPSYAKEIQTSEYGCGLEEFLKKRRNELIGILNGINTDYWNPAKDRDIFYLYDVNNVEELKPQNKKKLQEILKLPKDDVLLLGLVSRLAEQKGIDLIIGILSEIVSTNIQLVLLGTGDKRYEVALRQYAHYENVSINIGFDPVLAKRIYSGADIFLMPSRYEPCGLGQMIAMRYGTVPLVRKTGGLRDTVIDIDEDRESGNGFAFEKYESKELFKSIRRAREIFRDKKLWWSIVERCMVGDFSWKKRASEYVKLYRELSP